MVIPRIPVDVGVGVGVGVKVGVMVGGQITRLIVVQLIAGMSNRITGIQRKRFMTIAP